MGTYKSVPQIRHSENRRWNRNYPYREISRLELRTSQDNKFNNAKYSKQNLHDTIFKLLFGKSILPTFVFIYQSSASLSYDKYLLSQYQYI